MTKDSVMTMNPVSSVQGEIRVPGSKSYTNRALVAAALASGESELTGVLQAEDSEIMVRALKTLGFSVEPKWREKRIRVQGLGGRIPADKATLDAGNAGTVMRFLLPLTALGRGEYRLTGSARMQERPIRDLVAALTSLGLSCISEKGNGCPPVRLVSRGLPGGLVRISGETSSQFLSGLLLSAPYAQKPLRIELTGELASAPYVQMTLALMEKFGVTVKHQDLKSFQVENEGRYKGRNYAVEPDASAATCVLAAPLVAGGRLKVLTAPKDSLQADNLFLEVLKRMGARLTRRLGWVSVAPGEHLKGVDEDLNAFSDSVPALAALACFASSPSRIRNIALVRGKESDRIGDLAQELRRAGADIKEHRDGLEIRPAPLHEAELDPHDDHRLAMAFGLLSLKVPGIRILNPGCVAKTYPDFFKDLESVSHR